MHTLIHAGTLITATEHEAPRHNQGVLIRDGLIAAVDDWGQFAGLEDAQIIDASRATVMPGLIDAHTHVVNSGEPDEQAQWLLGAFTELPATTALRAAVQARRHLDMGVTTIRDLGARDWVDIALRNAIGAGWAVGPRILACGHGITSPGGHMDARRWVRPEIAEAVTGSMGAVAEGPDQARRAAWEQLMRDADVIKINATLSEYVRGLGGQCSPEMTYDMMQAICDVAHGALRKVAAHCHGGPGIQAALDAGVDTFEHGRFLTDEQLEQMAEGGRFLVPTLSPEARSVDANDPPRDPATRRWSAMAAAAMYPTVERAYRLGVPIVAGTDAGMPHVRHGEIAYEMWHLAHAGLSNAAAIASGTQVAAQALGLGEQIGQVHQGFAADLLVVDGNPLDDLALLQNRSRILAVIQNGATVIER